jgi:beta-lactamase class D
MIMKRLIFIVGFLFMSSVSFAQDVDRSLLQGYDASLVIYNRTTGEAVNIDTSRSSQRLSPCSTFKIYNTLIGLELGLIKGADEPWYK